MYYDSEILENKEFKFFKQLMYNIAVAICIMLVGAFVLVYGFQFKLYNVMSGSEEPYIMTGDMVIVKAQDEYKEGDIIEFDKNGTSVTHRLIAIFTDVNGVKYYLTHGDAVQSANPDNDSKVVPWEEDSEYVKQYMAQCETIEQFRNGTGVSMKQPRGIDTPTKDKIGGIVVGKIANFGFYFTFIQEHPALIIAIVGGIWCISSVIQNEIEMKKARRLY